MAIKLMATLVLSLFFCEAMFAQNEPDSLVQQGGATAEEFQRLEQELLEYVEKGVKAKLISPELRDSILQYVRETKTAIAMKMGVPMLVESMRRDVKLTKKQLDLVLEKSPIQAPDFLDSSFHPDKLPVPERDKANKNRHQYVSEEEMKRDILRIDYFSKGMDGYYQKQIALGQVGQGWEETREMRELVTRVKASILANLYPDGYVPAPSFLGNMHSSKNPFVRFIGGLLGMFQNGAQQQMNPAYKTANPLAPIPVPARR